MTTTHAAATKVSRRRRGIEPYLRQIEAACADGAPRSLRVATDPDAAPVPLDPWAVGWIQACAREPKGPAELPDLLKQCLAFLVKSEVDVARLRKETPCADADFYAVQAELMLGSAVGMALLRETQKSVDDLVALGKVDDARMLARLQNRLRSTVRGLKQSIAASNRGRDDELVEQFTDHAPAPNTPTGKAHHEETEERTTAPRRAAEPAAIRVRAATFLTRRRLRTEILFVSVLVAVVVWLAGRESPERTARHERVVSRGDFSASAPILRITAPRPSAYVVVDPARWTANDEAQQQRLVETMGAVLAANRYWGLLVRTPDGKAVARWVAGRGGVLLHDVPAPEHRDEILPARLDRVVPAAAPERGRPGAR